MLAELTANKMILFPFISEQRIFGYSDNKPKDDAISRTEQKTRNKQSFTGS